MINGKNIHGIRFSDHSSFAHIGFFNAVCDEITKIDLPVTRDRLYLLRRGAHLLSYSRKKEHYTGDIVITESIYEYAALHKRLYNKKLKIVELFASPKIFKVFNNETDPFSASLMKSLIKEVDGFLPVSRMCADFLTKNGIDKPAEVVYPYIKDEKYGPLEKNAFNPQSKTLVCVGGPVDYKGTDVAIKVFDKLAEADAGLKLRIVAKGLDGRYLETVKHRDRITVGPIPSDEGYCTEVGASVAALHFGRYDTFPIATLETMLGGIPTFVSRWTGTKEVVGSVDKSFVLDFDIDEAVGRVGKYLESSDAEKAGYSRKFKDAARPFGMTERIADFKAKFGNLVSRI
jgi:glycosyltransferase involved in cell wall biosynthesis